MFAAIEEAKRKKLGAQWTIVGEGGAGRADRGCRVAVEL